MTRETLNWVFYTCVLLSFCSSAVGYATREQGWYVLGVCMATGALVAAVALATVDPSGAGAAP